MYNIPFTRIQEIIFEVYTSEPLLSGTFKERLRKFITGTYSDAVVEQRFRMQKEIDKRIRLENNGIH